jgi:hypothetical protein
VRQTIFATIWISATVIDLEIKSHWAAPGDGFRISSLGDERVKVVIVMRSAMNLLLLHRNQ